MLRLTMDISQIIEERKDFVVSNKLTKIYEASNDQNFWRKKLTNPKTRKGTKVSVLNFRELNLAQP